MLILSFLALGALWKSPQLDRRRVGHPLPAGLERFLRSPVLHGILGAISAGLLVLIFLTALIGEPSSAQNIAPTFIYVIFWLGLVPVQVRVRERLARCSTRGSRSRTGSSGSGGSSGRTGSRRSSIQSGSGCWPAAFFLLCFAAMELVLRRAGQPAGAGARDCALQLRDVVRHGRLRAAGVGLARERLHRLLRPARADRAVRRARGPARAADAVLRSLGTGHDAGPVGVRRGDARLGRLRRLQPLTVLARPSRPDRGAVHRRSAGPGGALLDGALARRPDRLRAPRRARLPRRRPAWRSEP